MHELKRTISNTLVRNKPLKSLTENSPELATPSTVDHKADYMSSFCFYRFSLQQDPNILVKGRAIDAGSKQIAQGTSLINGFTTLLYLPYHGNDMLNPTMLRAAIVFSLPNLQAGGSIQISYQTSPTELASPLS
jgi:hypothetical protein